MKTIKKNSIVPLLTLSLVLSFLLASCGQTGKESNTTEKDAKTTMAVDPPKIDIQAAILSDDLNAVKQHIKAGTDINKKDAMSGSTPLITSASFGKIKMVKALMDAGADLTLTNNDGATALHVAAFFCRVEIVQMLMDAKVDTSVRNNFGATPRETVMAPFKDMKPIYEMLGQQLAPMGMKIDLEEIEKTRPVIALMLQ